MKHHLNKIVVIGAGQLGSRHLQALSKLGSDTSIEVVDPNPVSIDVSKSRIEESLEGQNNPKISYFSTIADVSDDIDLCIVATNSDIRLQIIGEILLNRTIKYMILEKFLFQKDEDYVLAEHLFNATNTQVWVNCPRRLFAGYQKLKNILTDEMSFEFKVNGGEWGLCCNSIHFIDLLSMLSKRTDYRLNTNQLDHSIMDSKRPGFKELTGTLVGEFIDGYFFELTSIKGSSANCMIEIISSSLRIQINEQHNEIRFFNSDNELVDICSLGMEFQSTLTHLIAMQLIETGTCLLPTFTESKKLHQIALKSFIHHMEKISNHSMTYCPIT